jgi:hypothetical protein
MSGSRTPVWKAPDETIVYAWKERWDVMAGALFVCFAVVFFVARITPWLSDTSLFWLKLVSFIITAMLGVVGVVTDFKDANKNLTRPGKLNLAGLALAAVIGIMAQKAEYASNRKASDEARDKLSSLNRQNQAVLSNVESLIRSNNQLFTTTNKTNTLTQQTLHQVSRNLESMGETIFVSYKANFLLENSELKKAAANLSARARKLPYDDNNVFRDDDTYVERVSDESGEPAYEIRFDMKSMFASDLPPTEVPLSHVPFDIRFHKGPPHLVGTCERFSEKSIANYEYDEGLSIQREPWSGLVFHWGPLALVYKTKDNFISQSSEHNVVFRLLGSSTALSALDFSQAYMIVWVYPESISEFTNFSVTIGKRTFKVPMKEFPLQHSPGCPGFMYQLPIISSN